MITIKKLSISKWKELQKLRFESLKSEPIAFGSSVEDEKYLSEEEWNRRIRNTLFAISNKEIIGMVCLVFNSKIKQRHIANIYGFYVKTEYRGENAGSLLLEHALKISSKNKNIIKVQLNVNPKQKTAVNLYKKNGFKIVGKLKKELNINNKFYDEFIMEKYL